MHGARILTLIFSLVLWTAGLLLVPGVQAVDEKNPSGCIACHTDEKALVRNLAAVQSKKSASTSGAG